MTSPFYSEFQERNLSDEEATTIADWIAQDLKFGLSRMMKYMALVDCKNTTQTSNLMKVHKLCKPRLIEAIDLDFIPRSKDSEYFEA